MSAAKKPRADSVLKTLPEARQTAVAEYARDHSLKETRTWLAADGLKTSEAALSLFLSWYALQHTLRQNANTVDALLVEFKSANPGATPDQIQQVGQSFFTALALQQQDPKQWFMIQQTAIKKEQLALDRQKFQRETVELFIKWSNDRQALELATSNAPTADKTEKLGQRIFGSLWE
jgi:hypothetical protein